MFRQIGGLGDLAICPDWESKEPGTGPGSPRSISCVWLTDLIAGRGENSVCRPEQLFIFGFVPAVLTGVSFVMLLQSLYILSLQGATLPVRAVVAQHDAAVVRTRTVRL